MKNLEFRYKNTALISDEDIKETARQLEPYLSYLVGVVNKKRYERPESFIYSPADKELYQKVEKVVKEKNTGKLKYIIVVGIGGSNLGTLAIYEALYGTLDPFLRGRMPKMLFADTTSETLLQNIKSILENDIKGPEELVLNVISKSGTNTEPLVNFETVYNLLTKKLGDIKNRVVVTTAKDSPLWEKAEKKGFTLLPVPPAIGGRYSVLTPVGIFPLMLLGIDISSLLKGAEDMASECLNADVSNNPALTSASLIYAYYKKGITIHNNFFFNPELESLGKWYRQLMGESIAKEKDLEGKTVNVGITPIVSIGSTDLHSMAQLYLGGLNDKFTYFTYSSGQADVEVPADLIFDGLVEGIKGKKYSAIMEAILGGVKKAYLNKKIPFGEINLPDISPYSLGQYFQFRMIEIIFLGKLLNVNAFDQPNVDEYKRETRRLLLKE